MASKIFVNLPVKDLQRSIAFFTQLGFSFNPRFTDDKAACMVIADGSIYSMLITEEFFRTFTKKDLSDAKKNTEVLIAIDAGSRKDVDDMIKKALAAGGATYMEPQDHGWMYGHSFADPDGHQWEILYMDESGLPQ